MAIIPGITVPSIKWNITYPSNPSIGDCVLDTKSGKNFVWSGIHWEELTGSGKMIREEASMVPTEEQLEKYPALKNAWEAYLIIKKTIGK